MNSYISRITKGIEYVLLQSDSVARLYWNFAPKLYSSRYELKYQNHNAPLDLFKNPNVSPEKIKYITGRPSALRFRSSFGRVEDGDWDLKGKSNWNNTDPHDPMEVTFTGKRFDETIFYKSLENRFVNNKNWMETEFVSILMSEINDGKTIYRNCTTEEDILDRCEEIDELYENIQKHGYRPQSDFRMTKPTIDGSFGFIGELTNEVCVDIGRNGELMFVDGKHRLAIAKILNLGNIPVTFLVRHEEWMKYREQVYSTNKRVNHPDLVEFD